MNFLINLDYLLTVNKMTRSELARKIEIAPSTINAWYTKDYKGITLKNLVKLSKCFDITIEDLVNGDIKSLSLRKKRELSIIVANCSRTAFIQESNTLRE